MLARISSGAVGVREYLEVGRKKGREFERDLIDERFVLAGDLETTDTIIQSIQPSQPGAARFLHITLGFAERFTLADAPGPGEVNLAVIRAVTEQYRVLLMAAYHPDEYHWYAEAHIPKVSHDLHATTGEALERLPHVHIVLPMRNLVDGRYLNPTGFGQFNIGAEQAIQEVINARFGLRSPLEAARAAGLGVPLQALASSAPLARHNAALADSPKLLKQQLGERIAAGDIASFDQLIDAASAYGEVRVRDGRGGQYLNVKPSWASKGINLKDFARGIFEGEGGAAARLKTHVARAKVADFEPVLQQWTEQGALEARFVNAANRQHYRRLDTEGRARWLAERAARAKARLRTETGATPQEPIRYTDKPDDRPEPERRVERAQLAAIAVLQRDLDEDRRRRPPESLASVRKLSSVPLVQHAEPFAELLHADAPADLGSEGRASDAMRWQGAGHRGNVDGHGKRKLDVIDALGRARAVEGPDASRLKSETRASLVIEAAARRFGLDRSQYDVTSGRDGTPRIRHKDRHYNLGDFFTKHLNVPWNEAKAILERCYYDTLADALPAPDKDLWASFSAWRDARFKRAGEDRERIRVELNQDILAARTQYKRFKLSARRIAPKKRQAAIAAARAEQIVGIERSRAQAAARRAELIIPPRNAQYRTFLTELANAGQLNALAELRRLAQPDPDQGSTLSGLGGPSGRAVLPLPDYRIDHAGRVSYLRARRSVVVDSAKGVTVVDPTRDSYALALKVAVARYGTELTFTGDAAFMQRMLEVARASRLRLSIRDGQRPSAPPIHLNPTMER